MRPELGSDAERRLLRIFRSLAPGERDALLAFAEFLRDRGKPETTALERPEPVLEPRPAQESVIAAIRRMRRSYPMLDSAKMLNDTSTLMSAHVLQGRSAADVIDELEELFAVRYREYTGDGG